jgi:hypothetical protein
MSVKVGDIVGSLVCVAMPPETRTQGLDGNLRIALRAGTVVRIGHLSTAEVTVRSPHIAPSQASLIRVHIEADGRCRARDSGHNFTIRVNNEIVNTPRVLSDGDVIEACLLDEPLGLRFRFESP